MVCALYEIKESTMVCAVYVDQGENDGFCIIRRSR